MLDIGSGWGGTAITLARDGVALLHAIGRADGPGATNPWIRTYLFPGAYCPPLSEVLPAFEASGLWATDIEVLHLHDAMTIAQWRARFAGNRDTIAALRDERVCRVFEFYLAGVELIFRHWGHMVWQVQLAPRQESVPLTRDHIGAAERATARQARESA